MAANNAMAIMADIAKIISVDMLDVGGTVEENTTEI
jgi:hypothetical protein